MPDKWEPKERKSFPFELEEKGLDPDARTIKGYAAVMGNIDDGKDVIDNGAFKKTLGERGSRVKIFYIHDFHEPIGKPLEANEVPRSRLPAKLREKYPDATGGLYTNFYVSETRRGNDAMTLARDGVLDELSIGYDAVKEEYEDLEDGRRIRHLKEIKLYDISLVPMAMNPAAIVTDVKELKPEETEDYIRIPVESPGKHTDHRIRTITISAKEGIKALYCGECKVIITYLFAKDKGWTMEKARAWVKEHKKGEAEWIETAEAQEAEETRQAEELQKALIAGRIQQAQIQRQRIEAL